MHYLMIHHLDQIHLRFTKNYSNKIYNPYFCGAYVYGQIKYLLFSYFSWCKNSTKISVNISIDTE